MPFGDNAFDVVASMPKTECFQEIYKILRTGAYSVISWEGVSSKITPHYGVLITLVPRAQRPLRLLGCGP